MPATKANLEQVKAELEAAWGRAEIHLNPATAFVLSVIIAQAVARRPLDRRQARLMAALALSFKPLFERCPNARAILQDVWDEVEREGHD